MLFLSILLVIVLLITVSIAFFRKNKKTASTDIKTDDGKISPKEDEEVDILKLYEENRELGRAYLSKVSENVRKEVSDDTLDLDDLFKTISISKAKFNDNFDFGLKRVNKGWLFFC